MYVHLSVRKDSLQLTVGTLMIWLSVLQAHDWLVVIRGPSRHRR